MGRLTLRLPDTLHRQLETLAQRENISLNQYLVYALTRQATLAYSAQAVPQEARTQQEEAFISLLHSLGQASEEEIEQVMAERGEAVPEEELNMESVRRLQARLG